MSENYKTAWLDSKGRVIYRSPKGALYVKSATGKKIYGVKPNKPANKPANKPGLQNLNKLVLSHIAKSLGSKNTMSLAKALNNQNLKRQAALKTIKQHFNRFNRTVTFMFRVSIEYPIDNMTDAKRVAKWFESFMYYYDDVLESFTVQPQLVTIPKRPNSPFSAKSEYCMVGRFKLDPYIVEDAISRHALPRDIKNTMKELINPDDDGNFPITFEGQEYLVSGYSPKLISIE